MRSLKDITKFSHIIKLILNFIFYTTKNQNSNYNIKLSML